MLFRLLNASATENVTLALAGHKLNVVALDGNRVPRRAKSRQFFSLRQSGPTSWLR